MGVPTGADLENRDPNEINDHLKVTFEDVLAEPDGAHANDCVWQLSYRCFSGGKSCCYKVLTLLCGCWIALYWGCEFACITFVHVYNFTPCLRLLAINCGCMQKAWGTCLQCFLAPVCETFGLCLGRIGINQNSKQIQIQQTQQAPA